jgi:AcrR family transcriptional regulator
MQRNSQETRKRILKAVGRLLARSGFRNVGINSVAREAGVDKVLIYRYFGGLPDLLEAFAEGGDFWPSADELLAAIPDRESKTEEELAAGLLIEFGRALRRRPITQEIMRWEILEKNQLTDALSRYREEQSMKLLSLFRDMEKADVQAIGALLGAGQTYLLLRSKTTDIYSGLALKKDQDWKRVEEAIRLLVGLAFRSAAMSSEVSDSIDPAGSLSGPASSRRGGLR